MISTHILDTANGRPANGVDIALEVLDASGRWEHVATGTTNTDGRAASLADAAELSGRTVRLRFETGAYFERERCPIFFPWVEVTFAIAHGQARYHVPLLLSPFGYSIYRGS
jgi:5-hydroxyisourate hydrolase